MKKIILFVVNILLPLSVGFLSSEFTKNAPALYSTLKLPVFAPPSIVFPIVWSVLYFLMGVSSFLVIKNGNPESKKNAISIYFTQLFFNFLWSVLFFEFKLYWIAFIVIILLVVLIGKMIFAFYKEDKLSAYLQIPYLLWVLFASLLNLSIALMN